MEIRDIEQYYNLKGQGTVTLTSDGTTAEINFKRFSPDTGEEMPESTCHAQITLAGLMDLKAGYENKIVLIDSLLTEIEAL